MTKLFTTEKLKGLGFIQVREGGYTYMMLEAPSGVTLVTGDLEDDGSDIPNDEFLRVYDLADLKTQLSEKQIKEIIYGEGQ